MTLRSPSEKLESNAIKKFKTGKLLPNWPHLAANPLACSGRKWGGLIWPQLPWLVLAATQMALCGRKFTNGGNGALMPIYINFLYLNLYI
jgi:hypothetical protein